MSSRKPRAAIALLVALAAIVPLIVGSEASAVKNLPLVCKGAAVLDYNEGTPDTWTISGGAGLCTGNLAGSYTATFTGTGTSTGVGLCEKGGDLPVVSNLDLTVNLTLTSTGGGNQVDLTEHWVAPVTTFPVVMPFASYDGNSLVGGGYISSRIFLKCKPGGSPASTVFRVRLSPV